MFRIMKKKNILMGEYNDEVFETNMQEFFLIVFLENMVKIFF